MLVKNKEIKGFSFADGVHWYWGDMEVAVIDPHTSEIEWSVRKCLLPEEVIKQIRDKKPRAAGTWIIEAKRISHSLTQQSVEIQINGKPLISFEDKIVLNKSGDYVSTTPDDEIGKFVIAAFWHKYDDVYRYSDLAKWMFCPVSSEN